MSDLDTSKVPRHRGTVLCLYVFGHSLSLSPIRMTPGETLKHEDQGSRGPKLPDLGYCHLKKQYPELSFENLKFDDDVGQ